MFVIWSKINILVGVTINYYFKCTIGLLKDFDKLNKYKSYSNSVCWV